MASYGARQEAWNHFASVLGLTADILPVVSNPLATISPDSKMQGLGKTPSVYNFRRHAAGFPKWTQHVSSPADIEKWQLEEDYGICLQCRTIRAIDIDVPDLRKAAVIVERIKMTLPVHFFPERHRKDTGKTLLAFKFAGGMPKRVIPVDGGVIEFLGDGQQFVAAGMHIDSLGLPTAPYRWRGGLPVSFPELDEAELEGLWEVLCMQFATAEPKIARMKREPQEGDANWAGGDDPVADFLVEKGHVIDQDRDGRLFITCPFESEHTSANSATGTAYYPAGTGGYEQGHFVCLHAHCTGRPDIDFRSAIGYEASTFPIVGLSAPGDGVADVQEKTEGGATDKPKRSRKPTSALTAGEVPELPADWPRLLRDGNGRIEGNMTNLVNVIGRADMVYRWIAFDQFTHGIMWAKFDVADPMALPQWQPWADHDYAKVQIELEARGFKPFSVQALRAAVNMVAQEAAIDTAIAWLGRLKWDGKKRVDDFMVTHFGCEDTPYAHAVGQYIWTALAGRVLVPGAKADMVPVLISPQGDGKTSAIEALVPDEDFYCEINLSKRDEDTSRRLRGKLVAELEELRGLKGRAAEDIKAFISRRKESWIPKFMEMEAKFFRRCLFFGTGNDDEFLSDPTGERRWLPMLTGIIDLDAIRRDRDQLWAEGASRFRRGGIEYGAAELLAKTEHHKFKSTDPWFEQVAMWLVTKDSMTGLAPYEMPHSWSTADVARSAIGVPLNQINHGHTIRIGNILRQLGALHRKVRKIGGTGYSIEAKKLEHWIAKSDELSDPFA